METKSDPEHSVIVYFNYGIQGLEPLHKLEKKLEQLIKESNVGEYDGHEIAMDYSDGTLYMYGPDAYRLFNVIKPTLEEAEFMKGAKAVLCYSLPVEDTKEIVVEIDPEAGNG